VRAEEFKLGQYAVYIPPDSVVPTAEPEFSFLREQDNKIYEFRRIKVRKFRGLYSQGLLVPIRQGFQLGQDVSDILHITHYEPELNNSLKLGGISVKTPTYNGQPISEYTEIENYRKYNTAFDNLDCDVVISCKIHGANFRAVHTGKKLYVGSHHQWKLGPNDKNKFIVWLINLSKNKTYRKYLYKIIGNRAMAINTSALNLYWEIAIKYDLENILKAHPGITIYGEMYGSVQKGYLYDATPDEPVKLVIFDVKDSNGKYWDYEKAYQFIMSKGLNFVPILYKGPWDSKLALELAEGKTTLGDKGHVREGVVVKPVIEQYHTTLGRLILKVIGNGYLLGDFDGE